MGVFNTIILNGDSRLFPKLNIKVDHILLDAPCSGTGLKLKKNKRLKPRILHDIHRHAEIQNDILEAAWKQLKVKGTLVYSTCSLEPEEGEVQISNFLSRHGKGVEILPINKVNGISGDKTIWKENLDPQVSKTKRIFPSQGMDGFFIALLKKVLIE
jgi:16S rRNA C967 or C1407 C5-methylase (RsmB/RsmF family)